jgi:broad specificity phosphatase PhoE
VLVRHARPRDAGAAIYGRLDVELGDDGHVQAAGLAETLANVPVAAVYTSPLSRARDTAGPLAELLGAEPVVVPDLRELDFGELEGLPHEDVQVRYPELLAWTAAPSGVTFPGGESVAELHRRAVAATRQIASRHGGETVVLVSHSVTLRAILADVLGMAIDNMFRLDIPHCSISVVDWYDGRPFVRSVNGGVPAE